MEKRPILEGRGVSEMVNETMFDFDRFEEAIWRYKRPQSQGLIQFRSLSKVLEDYTEEERKKREKVEDMMKNV